MSKMIDYSSMSGDDFSIFCKSFLGDLRRAVNLARSIRKFNRDGIPIYFSVPSKDVDVFKNELKIHNPYAKVLSDELIVEHCPGGSLEEYLNLDGRLSQQIIKSEAWRVLTHEARTNELTYLCVDSDSEFIQPFYRKDFFHPSGSPFTVMHDNTDLFKAAELLGKEKVKIDFERDSKIIANLFGRDGELYAFGPTPVVWSSRVWRELEEKFFRPRQTSLWESLITYPNELHLYGEALLKFQSIPVHPIKPLFKVYHYDWQYFSSNEIKTSTSLLAKNYLGVVKQSNWNYEMDHGDYARRKSLLSRLCRSVKRHIRKFFTK